MNKKTFLRRTLFFLMCLCGTSSVSALEVTIDGLVYDLSGTSATVLHVASGNKNTTIEIPASVVYEGLTYTVSKINKNAFCNFYNASKEFVTLAYYSMGTATYVSSDFSTVGACYWSKDDYAIAGANSYVNTVILPNSIKSIDTGAFYNNRVISVVMQEGITSIGKSAFGCTLISSILLPSSIQTIDDYTFVQMTKLTPLVSR